MIVIEEINRGNPAQIFGEMLTLLEGDKRNRDNALALSYPCNDAERVFIPPQPVRDRDYECGRPVAGPG